MIQKVEKIWNETSIHERQHLAEEILDFLHSKGFPSSNQIELEAVTARLRRYELKYGELIPTERALDNVVSTRDFYNLIREVELDDDYYSYISEEFE